MLGTKASWTCKNSGNTSTSTGFFTLRRTYTPFYPQHVILAVLWVGTQQQQPTKGNQIGSASEDQSLHESLLKAEEEHLSLELSKIAFLDDCIFQVDSFQRTLCLLAASSSAMSGPLELTPTISFHISYRREFATARVARGPVNSKHHASLECCNNTITVAYVNDAHLPCFVHSSFI